MGAADDFATFYDNAFARLVGQLSLVTGDVHEAEDVVQEAFARASTRWSRLRDYDISFTPGGTRLAELVLLDNRGATICGQRFDARPGHPPIYIDRPGDCMRLNGVR
jgi:RNA polymerase sigma-70 factor (ECF subfamily)